MKNRMYILSRHGDTTVEWDPTIAEETAHAERQFRDKLGNGMAAFAGRPDQIPVQIRHFDPAAEEIVFVPPIAGGSGGIGKQKRMNPLAFLCLFFCAVILNAQSSDIQSYVPAATEASPPSSYMIINGNGTSSTWLTTTQAQDGTGTLTLANPQGSHWTQGGWANFVDARNFDTRKYAGPGPSLMQVKHSGVKLTRQQLAPSAYVTLARMIGADKQAEEAILLDAIDTAGLKVYDFDKVDGYLMREARKRGPNFRWLWKPMRDKDLKIVRTLQQNIPQSAGIIDWQIYSQQIPMQAMVHAKAIIDQIQDAVFFVTDYEAVKPDPFLAVSTRNLLEGGKLWIIDQWDEPGFGVAPEPVKTPSRKNPAPIPLEIATLATTLAVLNKP